MKTLCDRCVHCDVCKFRVDGHVLECDHYKHKDELRTFCGYPYETAIEILEMHRTFENWT